MGTNYLGHFALTCLLGDRITDRVISVTSAHARAVRDAPRRPELADPHVLEVDGLRRVQARDPALHLASWPARGVRAYATDPGATDTDITRHGTGSMKWVDSLPLPRPYLQTPAQGARASLQAVTTDAAQRHLSRAALQSVGQAEGDQAAAPRPSTRSSPADCGSCRRS